MFDAGRREDHVTSIADSQRALIGWEFQQLPTTWPRAASFPAIWNLVICDLDRIAPAHFSLGCIAFRTVSIFPSSFLWPTRNQLIILIIMAFRSITAPCRLWSNAATPAFRSATRGFVGYSRDQRCGLATAVPPVTQDATGAKGPTAMVFMNMGGPSTTDQVEDFLSRLFVCIPWLSSCLTGIVFVLTHDLFS